MSEKCAFCGQMTRLVKSHIIPKGFYWGLHNNETNSPVLVSPFDKEFEKRCPEGIYEQLLCENHEEKFNLWDTHAIEVLRDGNPDQINGGWQYKEFEYEKIKLFFISLLWRAHATTVPFFDRVNLGSHADRLKLLIESLCPGKQSDYAVVLWRSDEDLAKVVIAPFYERYEGIKFLRFYLPGYMALIKIDQQPLPPSFKGRELPETGNWLVERRVYEGNGEERAILSTAKINLDRKNAKQHKNPKKTH